MDAQPIMRPIQPHQMSGDVRNALLVVMALIAAATFQAGLNPPGGVWQDTKNDHWVNHEAGTAILGSYPQKCRDFFLFNTLAFAWSIYVIMYLIYRFPLYIEIWIDLASFSATDAISIGSFKPGGAACLNGSDVAIFFFFHL
ncbi:hypothetical protein I3843_16G041600 [Carya illinoinensis]|uniref:PGG domain-containing protein n=1 Tax=Carya illinoinensis TaxID=32201 RepID=A0A8T1N392_CARIL|nr:hypothetical protein CIPAW_16G039100 [Carya illinoinensis]KAG7941413.1 hypothetical protein I3843_16G041600 [Carya illinoinensis]